MGGPGSMTFLSLIILTRGANMGMKALYVVVCHSFTSLLFFFLGKSTTGEQSFILNAQIQDPG
jgi:solute carrier family 12 sodium/potassium/chloride transporter 2